MKYYVMCKVIKSEDLIIKTGDFWKNFKNQFICFPISEEVAKKINYTKLPVSFVKDNKTFIQLPEEKNNIIFSYIEEAIKEASEKIPEEDFIV